MSGFVLKQIDELASIHGGAVRLAGDELGVESFGMQVLDFPAGFAHYPEHDHAGDDHEEVYVVLRGSAAFVIDGDSVAVEPGSILWVDPASKRKLTPGPHGVRILALGCSRGKLYERPEDFRVAAQS